MERSQTNKAWFVSTQILPPALPQPPGAEQGHGAGGSRSSPCARKEGTGWEAARGTSRVSSGGSAGSTSSNFAACQHD